MLPLQAYDRQAAEFKQAEARFKSQISKVKNHMDFVEKQLADLERKSKSIKVPPKPPGPRCPASHAT